VETTMTRTRQPGSLEGKTHLYVMPGVEIQISAEEAGMSPEQIRMLLKEVMVLVKKVKQQPAGAPHANDDRT
jgi:hypothetical protein